MHQHIAFHTRYFTLVAFLPTKHLPIQTYNCSISLEKAISNHLKTTPHTLEIIQHSLNRWLQSLVASLQKTHDEIKFCTKTPLLCNCSLVRSLFWRSLHEKINTLGGTLQDQNILQLIVSFFSSKGLSGCCSNTLKVEATEKLLEPSTIQLQLSTTSTYSHTNIGLLQHQEPSIILPMSLTEHSLSLAT